MPSAKIHPTAVVDPACQLADDVEIGPLCVLDGPIKLGPGCRLVAQVHLRGPLEVGSGCSFYPFSAVGLPAQHTGIDHDAPGPGVRIGDNCTFREGVTVHASMYVDEGGSSDNGDHPPTTIGNDCYLMGGSHIGHDVIVEDSVLFANSAVVGGHAHIGRGCFISGNASIHQRVRLGRGVIIQGGAGSSTDVPPFGLVVDINVMAGLNLVGMRRGGVPREEITLVREAYRRAFKSGVTRPEQQAMLDELATESPVVAEIAEFVRTGTNPLANGDGSLRSHHMTWLKRFLRTWKDGRNDANEDQSGGDDH
ncbi:MAG: acyl-ACP--UDP-N-acetylglucosamine O-acyltransferase [Planctomycetota bacterium]